MNKSLMIAILTSVLIGILTQLIYPCEETYYVGFALVTIAPAIIAGFNDSDSDDTADEKLEKWHKILPEDVDKTLRKIDKPTPVNVLKRSFFEKMFSFYCSIGMLIIAGFVSFSFLTLESFVLAAIILDAVAVPRAFHYIIYGKSPAALQSEGKKSSPIRVQLQAVNPLLSCHDNPSVLGLSDADQKFDLELELKLSKGNKVKIDDVRLQVKMKENYQALLCTMISISKNSVKSNVYPYAYYVIVLKGENYRLQPITDDLTYSCENTVFECESSVNDGNTIYVFTKKHGRLVYSTDKSDCQELYKLVYASEAILAKHLNYN